MTFIIDSSLDALVERHAVRRLNVKILLVQTVERYRAIRETSLMKITGTGATVSVQEANCVGRT